MTSGSFCFKRRWAPFRFAVFFLIMALRLPSVSLSGQSAVSGSGQEKPAPRRTILAVGAHAGDMEITAGALLAKQAKLGDRVVFLHLSLGEGGNSKMSVEEYGSQKRREAEEAAKAIKAEVLFGPYKDGEVPNTEDGRKYVADIIRQVMPTHILCHWKNSLHKDHVAAHAITADAVLLASLPGVKSSFPAHRGVRRLLFAENWEDGEDFHPYVYLDVSDAIEDWEKCVSQYQFIRGGISNFPYREYYRALFRIRGAEGGFTYAEAFDIEAWGKKQTYRSLP